jgi:hypothetical protein
MVEAPIAALFPFFRKRRRELLLHSSFLHSLYPSSTCDRMSGLRELGTYRLASPPLLSPLPNEAPLAFLGSRLNLYNGRETTADGLVR